MANVSDFFKDARKEIKEFNKGSAVTGQSISGANTDLGEYGKAKALLGTSVRGLQSLAKQLDAELKALNKSLGEFKKTRALIVAQADKGEADKVEAEYSTAIRECMTASNEVDAALKRIAAAI